MESQDPEMMNNYTLGARSDQPDPESDEFNMPRVRLTKIGKLGTLVDTSSVQIMGVVLSVAPRETFKSESGYQRGLVIGDDTGIAPVYFSESFGSGTFEKVKPDDVILLSGIEIRRSRFCAPNGKYFEILASDNSAKLEILISSHKPNDRQISPLQTALLADPGFRSVLERTKRVNQHELRNLSELQQHATPGICYSLLAVVEYASSVHDNNWCRVRILDEKENETTVNLLNTSMHTVPNLGIGVIARFTCLVPGPPTAGRSKFRLLMGTSCTQVLILNKNDHASVIPRSILGLSQAILQAENSLLQTIQMENPTALTVLILDTTTGIPKVSANQFQSFAQSEDNRPILHGLESSFGEQSIIKKLDDSSRNQSQRAAFGQKLANQTIQSDLRGELEAIDESELSEHTPQLNSGRTSNLQSPASTIQGAQPGLQHQNPIQPESQPPQAQYQPPVQSQVQSPPQTQGYPPVYGTKQPQSSSLTHAPMHSLLVTAGPVMDIQTLGNIDHWLRTAKIPRANTKLVLMLKSLNKPNFQVRHEMHSECTTQHKTTETRDKCSKCKKAYQITLYAGSYESSGFFRDEWATVEMAFNSRGGCDDLYGIEGQKLYDSWNTPNTRPDFRGSIFFLDVEVITDRKALIGANIQPKYTILSARRLQNEEVARQLSVTVATRFHALMKNQLNELVQIGHTGGFSQN